MPDEDTATTTSTPTAKHAAPAATPTTATTVPTLAGDKGSGAQPEIELRVEVIAVFGPTASGKSVVAEAVADRLGTEVVSADAMQVYRGLPILTNQPTRPTRLVAIRSLAEEMSVGAFAGLAHAEIDRLVGDRGAAVVSGGTGLYLRAALSELGVPPQAAPAVRERVEREVRLDRAAAHRRLALLDPAAAELVHPNDRRRLVRALELAEGGRSLVAARDRLWSGPTRRSTLIAGLDVAPDVLDRRIRQRTEAMFARGVVDEVRAALAGPVSRTAEKTLGLSEIAELEPGEALERIVVRTRRYAAYQRKWMRRVPGLVRFDAEREPDAVADEILAWARASS
jgi:tRNA dimethylallyltransferase